MLRRPRCVQIFFQTPETHDLIVLDLLGRRSARSVIQFGDHGPINMRFSFPHTLLVTWQLSASFFVCVSPFFCHFGDVAFSDIFVPLPFSLCMEMRGRRTFFPFGRCFSTLWPRAGFLTSAYVRIQIQKKKTPSPTVCGSLWTKVELEIPAKPQTAPR